MKQRRHLYFSSRIKEPFRRPFVVGFLWSLACWFSTQSMRAGSRRDISRRPCLQICKQRLLLLVALSINLFKFSCAANTKKYIYFSIDENKWEGLSWEKRGKELSRFTQRVSNQMLRRSANIAASWRLRQKKIKNPLNMAELQLAYIPPSLNRPKDRHWVFCTNLTCLQQWKYNYIYHYLFSYFWYTLCYIVFIF